MTEPRLVHRMDGFAPAGGRVRAVCTCGYGTTARASEERALAAMRANHEATPQVCALCAKSYESVSWLQVRRQLSILTDPTTGDQFLACHGLPQACRDGADQRQLHLDRAVAESFGFEHRQPSLRVIEGGKP